MSVSVEIPEKIFEMSDFLNMQDRKEPNIIGFNYEIYDMLKDWFEIVTVCYAKKEVFLLCNHEFHKCEIDALPSDVTKLYKIMLFAEANGLILLYEECALKLSYHVDNDINLHALDSNCAIDILKYCDTEQIISKPKEILKRFTFNPTFDSKYEDLFNIKTLYLPSKTFIYNKEVKDQEEYLKSKSYDVVYIYDNPTKVTVCDDKFNTHSSQAKYIKELTFKKPSFVKKCTGLLSLETVILPEGLISISNNMFSNCYKLKKVVFPSTLQIINNGAFKNCTSLEEVDLTNTCVKSVGYRIFEGCISLKKVIFPKTLSKITIDIFVNCINLEVLKFLCEDKIVVDNYSTLFNCDFLKDVDLDNTVYENDKINKLVLSILKLPINKRNNITKRIIN